MTDTEVCTTHNSRKLYVNQNHEDLDAFDHFLIEEENEANDTTRSEMADINRLFFLAGTDDELKTESLALDARMRTIRSSEFRSAIETSYSILVRLLEGQGKRSIDQSLAILEQINYIELSGLEKYLDSLDEE